MTRRRPRMLTPRQRATYDALVAHVGATGVAPTRQQLADALGLRSTATVQEHLDQLEQKGWITIDRGVTHNLTPLARPTLRERLERGAAARWPTGRIILRRDQVVSTEEVVALACTMYDAGAAA